MKSNIKRLSNYCCADDKSGEWRCLMIITKDSIDDFRKDFEAAIEAIQEKYDVTVDLGNITYYPDRFPA